MSSKNFDNKRTQSKLTFIKLNDTKKLKKDSVEPTTVDNVAELKEKQKETENIMDIDSTTTISLQTITQPTPDLLDLTDIVTPLTNPPSSNWAEEIDRMLVEQTSPSTSTSENTSSLEKNLTAAISRDDNTTDTNQNEIPPVDKEPLPDEEIFIRVLKVTQFFATVTKLELEGNITNKQIAKLKQFLVPTNGFLDVQYVPVKKGFTIYYTSEYALQKGVDFLKKQYLSADIIIGNSKHNPQKEANHTMVVCDILLNLKSETIKQYFTQYNTIIKFSITTTSL